MNIVFTDVFREECQDKFKITKEQVRQAIKFPDTQQAVEFDDLEIGLFVQKRKSTAGKTHLLVCARKSGEDWIVDLAFKILPDLASSLYSLEPVIVLQQFVQRFGLAIRIGQQLNRFVFNERIPIDPASKDVTKIVEVINPANHPFLQGMYIKIEQQHNSMAANCALAYAIDTEEYTAWLNGGKFGQDVIVEIAPQIRGHATPLDLITPNGTISFVTNYSEIGGIQSGFLFRLRSQDYYFEVGFTQSHFYFARNQQRLETPLTPIYRPSGRVHCYAMWEPTQLSLIMLDESYDESIAGKPESAHIEEIERRKDILRTSATIPPYSLLTWARRESIAPTVTYDSVDHFNEVVTTSLQSISDKVASIGLHSPFWDITYGQRIVSRRPKRETDIHPTIHALLFDIAIAKNMQISPEYPISGGRLDFLISGPLSTGELAHVCVEFKHAHSDDLVHGLTKQLPAYMQAKGCSFGIYCVMYFRGPYFEEPKEQDAPNLLMHLRGEAAQAGLENIRLLLLDFSHSRTPSRL